MNVPAFADKVGIRLVRRAFKYLAHLEKLGLVIRGSDANGKLRYQVTDRGLDAYNDSGQKDKTATLDEMVASFLR